MVNRYKQFNYLSIVSTLFGIITGKAEGVGR